MQNFKKFSKITLYIIHKVKLLQKQHEFQQQINRSMLSQFTPIDKREQFEYLEYLLTVSLFEKYQHSQVLIAKGINIMRSLLKPEYEKNLIKMIRLLSYESLNRANKQKIASILEIVKPQKKEFKDLVQVLENLIFSANDTKIENPLQKLLSDHNQHLINLINSKMKLREQLAQADTLTRKLKITMFEKCIQARDIFKISFDDSFYFDKASFEKRYGTIFGIKDATLDKFKALIEKREEKMKHKGLIDNDQ